MASSLGNYIPVKQNTTTKAADDEVCPPFAIVVVVVVVIHLLRMLLLELVLVLVYESDGVDRQENWAGKKQITNLPLLNNIIYIYIYKKRTIQPSQFHTECGW